MPCRPGCSSMGPSPLVTILTFLLPGGGCRGPAPSAAPALGLSPDHVLPQPPAPACRCRRCLPRPSCCCYAAAHTSTRTRAASCCWRRSSALTCGTWGATALAPGESGRGGGTGALGRHAAQLQQAARRGRAGAARLPPGTTRPRWQPASERCAAPALTSALLLRGHRVMTIGELRARRGRLSFPRLSPAALSTALALRAAFGSFL